MNNPPPGSNNDALRFVFLGIIVVVLISSYVSTQEVFRQMDQMVVPTSLPQLRSSTNCKSNTLGQGNDDSEYTVIEDVKVVGQDLTTTTTVLKQKQARGKLRHDWSIHKPLSKFAQQIAKHQANCDLPVATLELDNHFGFGSHVALWSQGMCNAMQDGQRMRTFNPQWLWLDQTLCDNCLAEKSPLLCYFPSSEFRCGMSEILPNLNVSDARDKRRNQCSLLRNAPEEVLHQFRAASTEYLFRKVSPVVIREAERQVGLLFGSEGAPKDLITVHIRWGDKFWEMDLAKLQEYIDAVHQLLKDDGRPSDRANIFVATEDPKVVAEFKNATPPGWTIYYDQTVEELQEFRPRKGNRASHMAKNTRGRAGLMGIGSLLLALEARFFVLTTKSNWSRVIDHLRKNVIDVECGNCTRMIDLRPGIW